jgi:hypothetical protein
VPPTDDDLGDKTAVMEVPAPPGHLVARRGRGRPPGRVAGRRGRACGCCRPATISTTNESTVHP